MATTAPATIQGFADAMAPNVTAPIALPHSWQNLLPGVSEAPHEAQLGRLSAAPQLLQNFPVAALPQRGHFVEGLVKTAPRELTARWPGVKTGPPGSSFRLKSVPSPWGDHEANTKDS